LTKVDSSHGDFQRDLAMYSSQLGRLRRLGGDLSAAKELTAQSLSTFLALTKKEPGDVDSQREYAEAQLEQAAQSLAAGQADAAHTQAQAALAILAPLFAKQPDDRATLLATMDAKLLLASVTRDAPAAQRLRNDALNAMQAAKSGRGDPRLLALEVEALLALDRKTEAQPLVQQLWHSGYRDASLLALLQHAQIDYPVNPVFQQKLLAATASNDHP
jgi:eukaryotic-like serine/threonine-protein kinase